MTKFSKARWVYAAPCLLSVAVGCSHDAQAKQDAPPPRVEAATDSATITIAHPERFTLVTATTEAVLDHLSGTCVVSPDVNRAIPVTALGSGRVVDLRASLGDYVRKGQTLVTISSPELSGALADHLKAVADETLARRQLDRARVLLDHGSIAKKELEAAEDAAEKAKVDVRTTEDRVRMLGGDPAYPTPIIHLTAPIDGTIIEQNITPAGGVKSPDNAPNLFTIADLSHVWVMCDVYENELSRTRVGEAARIRLSAYPDRSFSGRIGNISQVLDPVTRTAKLRIEIENRSGIMKPGMFAVAELESSAPNAHVVVPTSAVVQLQNGTWVFVKAGTNTFRRVAVKTGGEAKPGTQIVMDGITSGQTVVRNALAMVQAADQ